MPLSLWKGFNSGGNSPYQTQPPDSGLHVLYYDQRCPLLFVPLGMTHEDSVCGAFTVLPQACLALVPTGQPPCLQITGNTGAKRSAHPAVSVALLFGFESGVAHIIELPPEVVLRVIGPRRDTAFYIVEDTWASHRLVQHAVDPQVVVHDKLLAMTIYFLARGSTEQ